MLNSLRLKLSSLHARNPQELTRVELALNEIERGLSVLASLGHAFHLEDGPTESVEEYPKLMFHVSLAPSGREVRDKYQELGLGGPASGWFPTLQMAQIADGCEAQFAGRGGVPRKGGITLWKK